MKLFDLIKFLPVFALLLVNNVKADDALNHWYYRNSTPLNRVRFAGGLFFGLGNNGTLLTSPNGSNWTARATGTTDNLTGATYFRGLPPPIPASLYVVVGSSGTILTSTNAINWNMTNVGVGLNDVTSDGFYNVVAVTSRQPTILYAQNSTKWTSFALTGGEIESGLGGPYSSPVICYDPDDGIFVTAGGYADSEYDLWISDFDSVNAWTNTGITGATVTGIAYGNETMVAVGYEGPPRESTNGGYTWFNVSHGSQDVDTDITFGNGTFVVANLFGTTLFTATNSLGWQERGTAAPVNFQSVAYGNGVFVGVSGNNAYYTNGIGIYQSLPVNIPIITSRQLTNTNALDLVISGQVGVEYRLQTSTNFSTWSDLLKYTNTSPTMEYIAPITANTAQLFYRVVSP